MHILTEQLATEIVKRTMSIIDANINIMDQTGTIIASGDMSRIGQLHDGARRVINQKTTIEIDVTQVEQSTGSQSGINLPIYFQKNIVGVIGITGEPDHIRDYSLLIQMGAELTLEQAFLTKELQRDKQMRHNLLASILLESEADSDQDSILERARYAKLHMDAAFGVIVVYPHFTDEYRLRQLENQIKSWVYDVDEYFQLFTNQFIILKKAMSPNLTSKNQLKNFIEQKYVAFSVSNVTIAIGSVSKGMKGWRQSYIEAKKVIDVASILYPNGGVWEHEDLELEILSHLLMKESPDDSTKLIDRYKLLYAENDGEQLHDTLTTYMNENGKIANASEKLFIHRNTLSYRLDKIHNLTGKNPRNITNLLELKMAQILYSLSKDK